MDGEAGEGAFGVLAAGEQAVALRGEQSEVRVGAVMVQLLQGDDFPIHGCIRGAGEVVGNACGFALAVPRPEAELAGARCNCGAHGATPAHDDDATLSAASQSMCLSAGICLCGRESYFDSLDRCHQSAVSLPLRACLEDGGVHCVLTALEVEVAGSPRLVRSRASRRIVRRPASVWKRTCTQEVSFHGKKMRTSMRAGVGPEP